MQPETSSQEVGHSDLAADSGGTNGSLYHQHSWETAQVCKKLNAFLMGTHSRLGKASTFYELPDCPLQIILNFSVPYQVNLDPGPDAESSTIFLLSDGDELDRSGNVVFAPFIRPQQRLWRLFGLPVGHPKYPAGYLGYDGPSVSIEILHDGNKNVNIHSCQGQGPNNPDSASEVFQSKRDTKAHAFSGPVEARAFIEAVLSEKVKGCSFAPGTCPECGGPGPYTSDQQMQLRRNNKKFAESEYHSWCCDGCVSGAVSAASTGE
jgi:hypothetical protein